MSRNITSLVCLLVLFMLFPSADAYKKNIKCNETKEKSCNVRDIQNLGVKVVACTGLQHDNITVCHKGHCNISLDSPQEAGNDTSLILYRDIPKTINQVCVNGRWSVTDTSLVTREKRFVGALVGLIVGITAVAGVVICAIYCVSGGNSNPRSPPTIEPCPPSDIQEEYYTPAGETEMQINWTEPMAKGNNPTLKQVSGNKNGDIFEGSLLGGRHYRIKYEANDGLINQCEFSFVVKVRSCEPAPWVRNGKRDCPKQFIFGATCTYVCNEGYNLFGVNTVTCVNEISPEWTLIPECKEITCNENLLIRNGNYECNGITFGSLCTIRCAAGYTLDGPSNSFSQCQKDGTWSSPGPVTCKDLTAPDIICPRVEVFYADRGKNFTSVNWVLPTSNDTLDPNPDIVQTAGPDQGSVLFVGSYIVKYKAIDKEGNESPECVIEMNVNVISCDYPRVAFPDELLRFNCTSSVLVWGAECGISCVKKLPLNGSTHITCESNYVSTGVPTGYWDVGEGDNPSCREIACQEIDPPRNGALVHNTVDLRPVFIVMCNENFDIPAIDGFIGMLFCLDTGAWTPIDFAPDCIRPSSDRYLNLHSELLYYGGTCGTPETNQEILKNLNALLANVSLFFKNICPDGESCSVTNATIICGPVDTDVGNEYTSISPLNKNDNTVGSADLKGRHGRQIQSVVMQVSFGIIVDWNPPINLTLNEQFQYYDEIQLHHLKPYLKDLINDGQFDINEDFGFELDKYSLNTSSHGDLTCRSGYKLDRMTCKPCPAGYVLQDNECHRCPLGSYADAQGLTECVQCPYGFSTRDIGAKNHSKCIALCNKGYISSDGFVPCSPCGSGLYQNQSGQTGCEPCPPGTSTRTKASTSSLQCEDFDISFAVTVEDIHITDIPKDIVNFSLTFWVKQANPVSSRYRLFVTDGTIVFLSVTIENTVRIELFNNSLGEFGEVSTNLWTHVGVTMDTLNHDFLIYINGHLERSEEVNVSTDHFFEGQFYLATHSAGAGGILMSGFQMKSYVLTGEEIEMISSSCQTGYHGNGIINMDTFSSVSRQGISRIIPSICDPVDGCSTKPCGNHTCISRDSNYTCVCSNDMTGRQCDVHLDHCINIKCANGGTCTSKAGVFTCTCTLGYNGSFCEIPPVDGHWSEWSDWTQCSVSCGSGTRMRSRSCTEPPPDPFGAACVGSNNSEEFCNQEICRECPELKRKLKTRKNCTTDSESGLLVCTLSCLDWETLPPGIDGETFVNYHCGPATNYTWVNTSNTPSCVPYKPPNRYELSTEVSFTGKIHPSDQNAVISSVYNRALAAPCLNISSCKMDVLFIDENSSTSTQSTLAIRFNIQLNQTPDLKLEKFLENQTVSASLREVAEAVYHLETTAVYINESAADIFDTTVGGSTYTIDRTSFNANGLVSCLKGQTAKQGLCTECPAGTFANMSVCSFCDVGTYQSESGQTSCIDCPHGYTTQLIGSDSVLQCIETESDYNEPHEESSDSNLIVIVGPIVGIVFVIAVILVVCGMHIGQRRNTQSTTTFSNDAFEDFVISSDEIVES